MNRTSYFITARPLYFFFFFFNDTATTEIYTLSLHDALPISSSMRRTPLGAATRQRKRTRWAPACFRALTASTDRKSTRLNSSHGYISYAVFCLKKKKNKKCCNDYRHYYTDERKYTRARLRFY